MSFLCFMFVFKNKRLDGGAVDVVLIQGSYHVLPYFFGASTTFLVECFYFLTVICSHQFYAPIILLLSVLVLTRISDRHF
jgi:hypothetical protein